MMDLDLNILFSKPDPLPGDPISKSPPSLKVVSAIIGKCWMSFCTSSEIAKVLGVSHPTISHALRTSLEPSGLIEVRPDMEGRRQFYNHLNLEVVINSLLKFSALNLSTKDKKELFLYLWKNREAVGHLFLETYVLHESYEKGLWHVRKLYETIPELLLLLILSLYRQIDAVNELYLQFLATLYTRIITKVEREYPQLAYVWFGFLWISTYRFESGLIARREKNDNLKDLEENDWEIRK
ncbi:MAG: ArsR/SmtB family transcription factor [Candidatus Hodarchaeota archaeon]